MTDNITGTLAAYERGLDAYLADLVVNDTHLAFLEQVDARLPRGAHVLELGSGPGDDADWLEARGHRVQRSDASSAFADRLRDRGHDVLDLEVVHGDLGGPWDAVFANAVLLHLTADQLPGVLVRCAAAAPLLALSLKEGDGEAWSSAKVGHPRYFCFWREPALRALLGQAGFAEVEVAHRPGRTEDWLQVVAAVRA